MADQSNVSSDKRVFLDKNMFQYIDKQTIELTMPLVADGANDSVQEVVEHNLGFTPLVLAFISFPAVQASDGNYTRLFSGSNIDVIQSGGNITTVFVSSEEVATDEETITFTWEIFNETGNAEGNITVSIDYYILPNKTPPPAA